MAEEISDSKVGLIGGRLIPRLQVTLTKCEGE